MKIRLTYSVLFLMLLMPSLGVADEEILVNTSIKPPFSTKEETGFFDLLLKELSTRMDVSFKLVRQPPERALFSVNSGVSDMELPRVAGLEKKYPNLVMIPEKVIDYQFVAFSRRAYSLKSWDDLSDKHVGYIIGWKIFENNVPKTAKVAKLHKPDQLFDMISMNRIEIALYEKYAGWANIKNHEHDHSQIKECKPPLAVKPMYIYVHNSHKELATAIARHLQKMKADGTYQRIFEQTLKSD